jgi:hypothetical protein
VPLRDDAKFVLSQIRRDNRCGQSSSHPCSQVEALAYGQSPVSTREEPITNVRNPEAQRSVQALARFTEMRRRRNLQSRL